MASPSRGFALCCLVSVLVSVGPGGSVVAVILVLVVGRGRVALRVVPEQPADLAGYALEDGTEYVLIASGRATDVNGHKG
jgi:hypothetical protein